MACGGGVLIKNRRVSVVGRAFNSHHGRAKGSVDVEWPTVELVTGFELAVYFFGEMMEATEVIILVAHHHDIVGRRMGWISHAAVAER